MKLHIPLVCSVRCSVTGRSLCDAGLLISADGTPARVIRRAEGFVAFLDLPPGEHRLAFHYPDYREAHCTVSVREGESELEVVTLRPLDVMGGHLCRLTVQGLPVGEIVWISGHTVDFRLQQKECPAGTQEFHVYQKTGGRLIPPLRFLCADKGAPELGILVDMPGVDLWRLAKPLYRGHKRGVSFYLTQPYQASEKGEVQAIFFRPGPVTMLYQGELYEYSVEEGEQTWQIPQ